jgi:hypothetical protein
MTDRAQVTFWFRLWAALQRVFALWILIAVHYLLNRALTWLLPASMKAALTLLQSFTYVLFMVVYAYLMWDMVIIFVPLKRRGFGPSTEGGKEERRALPPSSPAGGA